MKRTRKVFQFRYAVELPVPMDPEAPYVVYDYYRTRREALRVARSMFGADRCGKISIVSRLPADE